MRDQRSALKRFHTSDNSSVNSVVVLYNSREWKYQHSVMLFNSHEWKYHHSVVLYNSPEWKVLPLNCVV